MAAEATEPAASSGRERGVPWPTVGSSPDAAGLEGSFEEKNRRRKSSERAREKRLKEEAAALAKQHREFLRLLKGQDSANQRLSGIAGDMGVLAGASEDEMGGMRPASTGESAGGSDSWSGSDEIGALLPASEMGARIKSVFGGEWESEPQEFLRSASVGQWYTRMPELLLEFMSFMAWSDGYMDFGFGYQADSVTGAMSSWLAIRLHLSNKGDDEE